MRTAVACCGINGSTASLSLLKELVADRRPDVVLFAGGVIDDDPEKDTLEDMAERRQFEFRLIEAFFSSISNFHCPTILIPGPHDAPLRHFVRIAMHTMLRSGSVHLVHCRARNIDGIPFFGVGGHVTSAEDFNDPVVRVSRAMADYYMQAFLEDDRPNRTLLLADAPTGHLGGAAGSVHAAELVDSCHPALCIVGGATQHKGSERLARTIVVNPGQLSDGSAAWIDREVLLNEGIEFIDVNNYS